MAMERNSTIINNKINTICKMEKTQWEFSIKKFENPYADGYQEI